uniref:Uncharacterized protein n=1 Tax=Ochrobactrum phage ORM_20 TaxID=2985243 RepID=A0A9N6ZF21_9VIRU|nr:hypothetical protein ORM20_00149 [Ochrobactrum phage ORM_20]
MHEFLGEIVNKDPIGNSIFLMYILAIITLNKWNRPRT